MANFKSLYEEKCHENELLQAEIGKLRAENVELRASTSTAVSFICTRVLF